jgi:putative ABC transport system permease protein
VRALWRVARADVGGRRVQSLLFALVVAVAAAGITAGLGQQRSAADRWDDAFARANGAHAALYGDAATLRRIRADPEVVEAAGPSPVANTRLVRSGREEIEDFEIRAAGARRPAVDTPQLFAGRWLTGRADDEVVVERSFALEEGIKPGHKLRIAGPGATLDARVVGVGLSLVDCFYPECESQAAWMSPATVRRLAGEEDRRALLLARIARPDEVDAFTARVERAFGEHISDLEDHAETRSNALLLNQFFGAFLAAFGIFLLVAAGLVVLSAASARVFARYRELGVLKALGFTPRALAAVVVAENLAIAAAGTAVGVVAGGFLAPAVQLRFAEVLERGRATFPAGVLAAAVLTVLAIVAAATALPAARAGRVPASEAIARGAAPRRAHPSRAARLAARLRLGVPVAVGVKDAFARPLRTWLAIATLAVSVVAAVAALALDRTVERIGADPALTGVPQALVVDPGEVPPGRIQGALAARPGVRSWFTVTERHAAVGADSFQLRAIGGDLRDTGFVIREGRMATGPGEAVIAYGLERRLGLHVGDRLPLALSGGRLNLRIVGRYTDGEDEGERAMITLADLRRLEPGAAAGVYAIRLDERADPDAVASSLGAGLPGAHVTVEETDTEVFDAFRAAFYVIFLLTLTVGLVNVAGTTLLGIRERTRDLAVLRTLGFTPRQVALSVAAGAAAVALVAGLVGVPLGLLSADLVLQAVGRTAGLGPELGASPAAVPVAVVALGVALVVAAVAGQVARRATRVPIAAALHAE